MKYKNSTIDTHLQHNKVHPKYITTDKQQSSSLLKELTCRNLLRFIVNLQDN